MRKRKNWTPEEINLLVELYPETPTKELVTRFNTSISVIYNKAHSLGIKKSSEFISNHCRNLDPDTGKKFRFSKGHKPWNKGLKGEEYDRSLPPEILQKRNQTQFKKGHFPVTGIKERSGAVRIRKDKNGHQYKWYKVDHGKWVMLHRKLWEDAYGLVPRGRIIVFKDGNTLNCELENLEMIDRAENMRRNTIHNYPEDLKALIRVNSKLKKKLYEEQNRRP